MRVQHSWKLEISLSPLEDEDRRNGNVQCSVTVLCDTLIGKDKSLEGKTVVEIASQGIRAKGHGVEERFSPVSNPRIAQEDNQQNDDRCRCLRWHEGTLFGLESYG